MLYNVYSNLNEKKYGIVILSPAKHGRRNPVLLIRIFILKTGSLRRSAPHDDTAVYNVIFPDF